MSLHLLVFNNLHKNISSTYLDGFFHDYSMCTNSYDKAICINECLLGQDAITYRSAPCTDMSIPYTDILVPNKRVFYGTCIRISADIS